MSGPQWVMFSVVFDCKHAVDFTHPPMKGEDVWCFKCGKMRKVESAPEEWRIRCKRCAYGRRLGSMRLNAEIAASKHANKRGHPVAIYNGKQLVYVVGERDADRGAQPELPLMHAEPPF